MMARAESDNCEFGRYRAPRWWGNGDWVAVTNGPQRSPTHGIGRIANISFINITVEAENGGLISGLTNGLHGLLLDNVRVKIVTSSNYSKGLGPKCFTPKGMPVACMGTRDYRPLPDSNLTHHNLCSYYCRTEWVTSLVVFHSHRSVFSESPVLSPRHVFASWVWC